MCLEESELPKIKEILRASGTPFVSRKVSALGD